VSFVIFWLLRKGMFKPLWPIWVPWMAYRYWRRVPPKRRSQVIGHARRLTRFALDRRHFR
jgi:hypothetical protein